VQGTLIEEEERGGAEAPTEEKKDAETKGRYYSLVYCRFVVCAGHTTREKEGVYERRQK
jgi:hypothetical protein